MSEQGMGADDATVRRERPADPPVAPGLEQWTEQQWPQHQAPQHEAPQQWTAQAEWQGQQAYPPQASQVMVQPQGGTREILTLPPLDELEPQIPISEDTGQPYRDPTMLVGMGLLYASSVAAFVGSAKVWWDMIHQHSHAQSAKLVEWLEAVSWTKEGIAIGVAVVLIGLVMVTAPAVAAFNAWNGYRWSRWAGVVAIALSCLAFTMNTWSLAAIPLAVLGTGLLFLPKVGRYFDHWAAFRGAPPPQPRDLSNVFYGPEPRFR